MKRLLLATLALAFACGSSRPSSPSAVWSDDRAAAHLDRRAQAWQSWSTAQRGEGDTQTACLCCHTVVPYAMARPLLGASPLVDEISGDAAMRADNFANLSESRFGLMYDFNEAVVSESRGTEAVLAAVVLAFRDRANKRARASESTRTALANLWATQAADGAWEWLSPQFELEPWESRDARYLGAALAVLAVGVAPGTNDHRGLAAAIGYLRRNRASASLHNQLFALWAATEVPTLLSPDERAEIAKRIAASQLAGGGFALTRLGDFPRESSQAADGYATGLAVIVLRAVGTERVAVERGVGWLRANQNANGAWPAASVNKPRSPTSHIGQFMSDAATAFAVMALVGT